MEEEDDEDLEWVRRGQNSVKEERMGHATSEKNRSAFLPLCSAHSPSFCLVSVFLHFRGEERRVRYHHHCYCYCTCRCSQQRIPSSPSAIGIQPVQLHRISHISMEYDKYTFYKVVVDLFHRLLHFYSKQQ